MYCYTVNNDMIIREGKSIMNAEKEKAHRSEPKSNKSSELVINKQER